MGIFFSVVVVGVHDEILFAESIKKEQKTKEKHRNSAGYESRTEVVKERPGIDVGGLFRVWHPSSDRVQLQNRVPFVVVLCFRTRGG